MVFIKKITESEIVKTHLTGLNTNVTVTNVVQGNIDEFKAKLLEQIKQDRFKNLTHCWCHITKGGNNSLTAGNIINNSYQFKVQ